MFSLPQTVGYAIRALSCLDEVSAQRRTAREIAACTDIPPSYLSKILRSMAQAGLIDSLRGHEGGFLLARPPRAISLNDVITAVDPRLRVDACFLGVAPCEGDEPCPLHDFWEAQRKRIERKLQTTTLAEVARFYQQQTRSCCTAAPDKPRAPRRASPRRATQSN